MVRSCILRINFLAKRGERQAHEFEMLLCEWQADDRDRQQDPENQVGKSDPDAAHEDPDNVENGGQAARVAGNFAHMLPEREERHKPDLETLNAERDADNGYAERQSAKHIFQKNDKSTEDKPDNVSDQVHDKFSLEIRVME